MQAAIEHAKKAAASLLLNEAMNESTPEEVLGIGKEAFRAVNTSGCALMDCLLEHVL